jgi:glycosyltransferase involved in cell wall biosynthesis
MQTTIAFLYSRPLHIGGVESHLLSLLRYSDKSRYDWLVIAPASQEFAECASDLGAQVISWSPQHILDVVALAHLVRLLRSHRVDLLHIHEPRAAIFGRVVAYLLQLPVVVTVHLPSYYFASGTGVRARLRRRFDYWIERILNWGFTNQLIYVSSRVCQEALDWGLAPRERAIVIQNGVDLALYAGDNQRLVVRRSLGTPFETVVICCVARLDRQKGIDVLLDALGQLRMRQNSFRLWLLGDGALETKLHEQVRRLGLETNVQFLGYRSDVPRLLQASDIFVLPSRYEAMPISLIEAMAAGLPSVVTNVGENSHMVEHGATGLVVPPEDSKALAEALQQLLDDSKQSQSMGRFARQKATNYSVEQMVKRTEATYTQVLDRARGRKHSRCSILLS